MTWVEFLLSGRKQFTCSARPLALAMSPHSGRQPITFANMVSFNLTWPLLQVFGSSAGAGRVVSAAAGSLLILSVLLLRKREGHLFAFAFAGLLALSPIAITLSRTAGSAITAALGVALMVFGYLDDGQLASNRRAILVGTRSGTGHRLRTRRADRPGHAAVSMGGGEGFQAPGSRPT